MAHAIYIWQATGKHADNNLRAHAPAGHILVKFGKTSTHLGDERLLKVARCYGFGVRIIHNSEAVDVYEVERKLLKLGEQAVGIHGKSGWTEFRYVSPADLVRARALVMAASAPEILAEAREQSSATRAQYAYESATRQQHEAHAATAAQIRAAQVANVRTEWKPLVDAAQARLTAAQTNLTSLESVQHRVPLGIEVAFHGFCLYLFGSINRDIGDGFIWGALLYIALAASIKFMCSLTPANTAAKRVRAEVAKAQTELNRLKAAYDAADTLPTNKVLALPNGALTQLTADVVSSHHNAIAFGQKFEKVFFHVTLWGIAVPVGLFFVGGFVYFRVLGN